MNTEDIPTFRRLVWLFLPSVIVAVAYFGNSIWLGINIGKPWSWRDALIGGLACAYCFSVIFINNRRDGMKTGRNVILSIAFAPTVVFANMVLACAIIFAGCVCSGGASRIGR